MRWKRFATLARVSAFSVVGAVVLILLASSASAQDGAPLTVVSDGRPEAVLFWWSRDSSPVPEHAATELRSYTATMSGATIRVVRADVDDTAGLEKLPSALALVPEAEANRYIDEAAGGRPKLPGAWFAPAGGALAPARPDSFALRALDGRVVLAGSTDRGTLYAAYDLLEGLGVRFYAPEFSFYGSGAERVPRRGSVVVGPLDVLEEPDFEYRRKYVEEGWSHTPTTLRQSIDWMAKKRLNTLVYPYDYGGTGMVRWDDWRAQLVPELEKRGMNVEVGGHGYQSFLPQSRYGAEHPDWFVPSYNVFDVRNEAALRTYAENVIAYLRARPEITTFDAWPPDGARWPPSVVARFGSVPNAQAHVAGTLAAAVRAALPNVRVESISYVPATDPPDARYMYGQDTIVDFAPYDRSYAEPIFGQGHPKNVFYDRLIPRWRGAGYEGTIGVYEYYRKYSWHSLPVVLPRLIGQEMPHYRSLGASGFGTFSEPADWITYEPTHLLVAEMSWDADLDPDVYVADYLEDRYGPAAADMKTYLRLVEEAGGLLFDRPSGDYGDRRAVAAARERYLAARHAVARAKVRAPAGSPAALLAGRLRINSDYAVADTEISYYRLLDRPLKVEEARERARKLAVLHRFDGIILYNSYSIRRFRGEITANNARGIREMYRREWR